MSGSASYVGSMSIGVAVPAGLSACVAGTAGINLALPDIEARLAALASFSPSLGSFAVDLELANQMIASINAAISVGITPPSISVQLALIAGLIADLSAQIVSINAQLSIIVDISGLLATAGLHVYSYRGAVGSFGGTFTTELSSGFPGGTILEDCNALVLATSSSVAWTAMQSVFKTA